MRLTGVSFYLQTDREKIAILIEDTLQSNFNKLGNIHQTSELHHHLPIPAHSTS